MKAARFSWRAFTKRAAMRLIGSENGNRKSEIEGTEGRQTRSFVSRFPAPDSRPPESFVLREVLVAAAGEVDEDPTPGGHAPGERDRVGDRVGALERRN